MVDEAIHDTPIYFPADARGNVCGHSFPPEHCPYEGCGYRGSVQQVLRLRAVLSDLVDESCKLLVTRLDSNSVQEWVDAMTRAKEVLDNSFVSYENEG